MSVKKLLTIWYIVRQELLLMRLPKYGEMNPTVTKVMYGH